MDFEEAPVVPISDQAIQEFQAVAGHDVARESIVQFLSATHGDVSVALNHYFANMQQQSQQHPQPQAQQEARQGQKRPAPEENKYEPEAKRARVEEKQNPEAHSQENKHNDQENKRNEDVMMVPVLPVAPVAPIVPLLMDGKEAKQLKKEKKERINMAKDRRFKKFMNKNLCLATSITYWILKPYKTAKKDTKLKPDYYSRKENKSTIPASAAYQLNQALSNYNRIYDHAGIELNPIIPSGLEALSKDYRRKLYECYAQTYTLNKQEVKALGVDRRVAEESKSRPVYQVTIYVAVTESGLSQSLNDLDNDYMMWFHETELKRYRNSNFLDDGAQALIGKTQFETIAPVMAWSDKSKYSVVKRLFLPSIDERRWQLSNNPVGHFRSGSSALPFVLPDDITLPEQAIRAFQSFMTSGGCGYKLEPYQEEAVKWMILRELSGSTSKCLFMGPFLSNSTIPPKIFWYSPQLSQYRMSPLPEIAGGILADEMGLGKTVEAAALVAARLLDARKWRQEKLVSYRPLPASPAPPPAPIPVPAPIVADPAPVPVPMIVDDGKDEKKEQIAQGGRGRGRGRKAGAKSKAQPKSKSKKKKGEAKDPAQLQERDKDIPMEHLLPSQATLFIVPTSCAGDWMETIHQVFSADHLKAHHPVIMSWYDNKSRTKDLQKLAAADAIVTTYPIVESECRAKRGDNSGSRTSILQRLYFHRIVLDESQTLASLGARTHAVLRLQAANKWCLGGTLMRKDVLDLLPQLQFLGIVPPFTSRGIIQQALRKAVPSYRQDHLRKLRLYRHHVAEALFTIMTTLVLRRKSSDRYPNGKLLCELPHRTFETIQVPVSDAMKDKMIQLHVLVYKIIKVYKDLDIMNSKSLEIQSHLLALRTWCSCGEIDFEYERDKLTKMLDELKDLHASSMKNKEEIQKKVQAIIQKFDPFGLLSQDCTICLGSITEATQTNCGHVFCFECINGHCSLYKRQHGEQVDAPCPICRTTVTQMSNIPIDEVKKRLTAMVAAQVESEQAQNPNQNAAPNPHVAIPMQIGEEKESKEGKEEKEEKKEQAALPAIPVAPIVPILPVNPPGEKLEALLAQLRNMKLKDPMAKAVIYTDLGRTKDKILKYLTSQGFRCGTIAGNMSFQQRKRHMDRFQTTEDEDVFVLSLKSNSEGVTLTRASYLFLVDTGLVIAKILQAMMRIYRYGQKQAVTIVQLIMKDTIEEAIGDRYCKQFTKSFAEETKLNQDIADGKLNMQQFWADQESKRAHPVNDVMTEFVNRRRKETRNAMKRSNGGASAAELFKLISDVPCVRAQMEPVGGLGLGLELDSDSD